MRGGAGLLGRGGRHARHCRSRGPGVSRIPYSINPVWMLRRWPPISRRWRPSSVPPQAAAFARAGGARRRAPAGRERAKNLLWAAGRLADYAVAAGPGAGAGGAAAPVGDRAVRRAPRRGCPAWRAGRCAPTCGSSPAGWSRSWHPADVPLPRERAKAPYSPAEIDGYPGAGGRAAHRGAADARGRAGLPGRRRRADPRRPARACAAAT